MNSEISPSQQNKNTAQNPWNPFIPTTRDLARTDELASKNAALAGVLSFLFVPAGLIYLNRGINTLKIFGYVFVASFTLGLVAGTEEEIESFSSFIGLVGAGAITAEQVMTVNRSRQRQQEKSSVAVPKN